MIIDKRARRQATGDRAQGTGDRRKPTGNRGQATAKSGPRNSLFSALSSQFSIRYRWVRLLLLTLAIIALSAIGATLGRGFSSGAAVVGQAVEPTSAAMAPPAALPTSAPITTSAPAPVAAAVPALSSAGIPPAAPAPPSTAHAWEGWPVLAEDHFDGISERWPEIHSSPSWSSSYQDGGYLMQVDSRPGISYSGPLGAHDFWYSADVRITRGQAGLFFLIGRPNDFYRLLIDADGHYQLEWQQVGVSQPLIAWTASDALLRGAGQVNQIAVRRSGDELILYANGTQLASYDLPAGSALESRIGLALDAPEGGRTGLAWFDNLVVRAPKR
jgi:hypothetical protein